MVSWDSDDTLEHPMFSLLELNMSGVTVKFNNSYVSYFPRASRTDLEGGVCVCTCVHARRGIRRNLPP